MGELSSLCRSQQDCGLGAAIINPDPDEGLDDIARRGYRGDCTKYSDPLHEFSPWQTGAVLPAKATGREAVTKCSCALTFLQYGAEYEVAVDWRWRRLGDAFWMQAF